MGPESWRNAIGSEAWDHIAGDQDPVKVAEALTRATEVGFTPPLVPIGVIREARTVIMPGVGHMTTAKGVEHMYTSRGHGFMLLRLGPLLRALAGPPLAQFQQLMFAYEEQCGIEGVDPIVSPWRVFLGGSEPHPANLLTVLQEQSPEPAQDRQVFKQ